MDPANESHEMGIAHLLAEFSEELTRLVRAEVALARAEMTAKMEKIARNAAFIAAGVLSAYTALIFVLLGAAAGTVNILTASGIDRPVATWLGPLLVGIAVGAVAATLITVAVRSLRSFSLRPTQTLASIEETRQWIERKIS